MDDKIVFLANYRTGLADHAGEQAEAALKSLMRDHQRLLAHLDTMLKTIRPIEGLSEQEKDLLETAAEVKEALRLIENALSVLPDSGSTQR